MKEIEKKDTPEVSGGYRDDGTGGGCIPIAPIGPMMPVELARLMMSTPTSSRKSS